MKKIFTSKVLLFAFLIGFSSGCSTVKLAYNNADFLLVYMIDDYFDLTDQQHDKVKSDVNRILKWHRNEELPDYISIINQFENKAKDGLTKEESNWAYETVMDKYFHSVDYLFEDIVNFMVSLNDKQINAMEEKFAEESEKSRKIYLEFSREEQLEKRVKRTIEQAENWLGDLTNSQIDEISKLSRKLPLNNQMWIEERSRRNVELVAILRTYRTKEKLSQPLRGWFFDTEKGRTPDYLKKQKEQYDKILEFAVAFDKLITKKQREFAFSKMNEYKDDFIQLIADGKES